jgi:hypothetical protein
VPVNSVARGLQFQHYDGRQLTIHGKAGKIRLLPVVDEDLRLELERHILERRPSPEEYLLYPEKLGPEFYGGPVGVIWENRTSELSRPRCTAGGLDALRSRACLTALCTRLATPP